MNFLFKTRKFAFKTKDFCIETEEFCINDDAFCRVLAPRVRAHFRSSIAGTTAEAAEIYSARPAPASCAQMLSALYIHAGD